VFLESPRTREAENFIENEAKGTDMKNWYSRMVFSRRFVLNAKIMLHNHCVRFEEEKEFYFKATY
jgi:hypothetical protein